MKIYWKDKNEFVMVDTVKVLKECIGCFQVNSCANDLQSEEISCYFLDGLYTKGESFRIEFEKEEKGE